VAQLHAWKGRSEIARFFLHLVVAREDIGSTKAHFTTGRWPALFVNISDVIGHIRDRDELDL